MNPIIFHIDMNNFYASVELLSHPEFRHLPVAVGGDPEARHGIVLARNQVAKELGIVTAETLYSAKQKAPNLKVLPPHRERYHEASKAATKIYLEYTDFVETYSLDEAWLDVTHHPILNKQKPADLAHIIRQRITAELGLTVSIGVSWNKTFAKLGSDYKKPNAVTIITPENFKDILYPLPIDRMLYVGPAAATSLRRANLNTIRDLAEVDPRVLTSLLGRSGESLAKRVRGEDDEPVRRFEDRPQAKSISAFRTLSEDVTDPAFLRKQLQEIATEISKELKEKKLRAETLQLMLRWSDFEDLSRQQSLPRPSQSADIFEDTAIRILNERIDLNRSVRAIGIGVTKLTSAEDPIQMTLFDLENKRKESRSSALLDKLPPKLREQFKTARELEP